MNETIKCEENETMKTFIYRATFDKTELIALGDVEAENENDAKATVYGMCGDWRSADNQKSFVAGCPVEVTIVCESPLMSSRELFGVDKYDYTRRTK